MYASTLGFHELSKMQHVNVGVISEILSALTPARVVVAGRDISVGSRPIANSVSALLVAFILANSYEPSSQMSSKPPATMTLALPDSRVSHAISRDCSAVALRRK